MRTQEAIRDELFRYREAGWPHLPVSKADALLGDALQVLTSVDPELRDALAMTVCETLIEDGCCSLEALKGALQTSLQRLSSGLGETGTVLYHGACRFFFIRDGAADCRGTYILLSLRI